MITVLSWLWFQEGGRATYTAENVNIWASMVRRHLSLPHEIACVTDQPNGIDSSIKIIKPPKFFDNFYTEKWSNGRPSCWRRLSMFSPNAEEIFGKRFVSMDLDCVIGRKIDSLFDRKEDLILYRGTVKQRPYNGSMMLITAGCRPQVFEDFSEEEAKKASKLFMGSDQSWLAYKLGWNEIVWSEKDGVYWYNDKYRRNPYYAGTKPKILFFPGKIKPWTVSPPNIFINRNYKI